MSIGVNNIGHNLATDGLNVTVKNFHSNSAKVEHQFTDTVNTEIAAASKEIASINTQVSKLQDIANFHGTKVHFNINEELGKVIIKVVDSTTDKVVREIPSEDLQKLQIHMKETLGLLIDENI